MRGESRRDHASSDKVFIFVFDHWAGEGGGARPIQKYDGEIRVTANSPAAYQLGHFAHTTTDDDIGIHGGIAESGEQAFGVEPLLNA